jgi:hypothetical protein
MKKTTILPLFFLSLITGCSGPAVTFEEPQPTGIKEQSGFSRHIKGTYLNISDSSVLTITDRCVFSDYDSELRIARSTVENSSDFKTLEDTLVFLPSNSRAKMVISGDSIFSRIHLRDTLFLISETNVLKKFKGHYFMNTFYGSEAWGVQKLSFSNGRLTIGDINLKDDLADLKEITETASDTLRFDPTRRQFRKFIRKDGFSNVQEYLRL